MNVSREAAKARRNIEEIAATVIDVALQLHRELGEGLLKQGLQRAVNNHTNFACTKTGN